ncbi:hypothetical protein Pelo_15971 [Pelomyxa schiedti]|nr:hypothetical protein Pelo_15971 [Pelomyxa schiedti]
MDHTTPPLNRQIVPDTPTTTRMDIQFLMTKFPQCSESVLSDAIDFCGGVSQADSFLENQQTMDGHPVHCLRRSEATEDLALLASSIPGVHPELGSSPSDFCLTQHYPHYSHSPLSPHSPHSAPLVPPNSTPCSQLTLSLMRHNQAANAQQTPQQSSSALAEALAQPSRDNPTSPSLAPQPMSKSSQPLSPKTNEPGAPPVTPPVMVMPSTKWKENYSPRSPSMSPPSPSPPSPPDTVPTNFPASPTLLDALSYSIRSVKIIETVKVEDHVEYVVCLQFGVTTWNIQRRYNAFYSLHVKIKKSKDINESQLRRLHLPNKKLTGKNSPSVIKERREQLELYMKELVLDNTFLQLPEVREFIELASHLGGH